MKLARTIDDVGSHLSARYPFIYLVSHEEGRVVPALAALAAGRSIRLCVWPESGPEKAGVLPWGGTDPLETLDRISSFAGPALFVLKDFHTHLKDAAVVRKLRDLAPALGGRSQAAVILAPVLSIPEELERDIAIIDVPLPDEEELLAVFNSVMVERAAIFPDDFTRMAVRAASGLTAEEARRAFLKALIRGGDCRLDDIDAIVEEKRRAIRRYEVLEFVSAEEDLGSIGGLSDLKKWLELRESAFSDDARAFGLPAPKGLLLCGVQGCGKSLTARAVAKLWKLPLLRLELGSLFSSGVTPEEALRRAVKVSTALAPSVMWIDEIEKGFSGASGTDASATRAFGMFITWMQEKKEPVFVVATANEVSELPPELLRKGRFDEIFFIDLPNPHERAEILSIHLRRRGRDPGAFDLAALARAADYFSGAELEQVVVSALYRAFSDRRELMQPDLERSASEIVPLYRTYEDRIKALREWAKTRTRLATSRSKVLDFFPAT